MKKNIINFLLIINALMVKAEPKIIEFKDMVAQSKWIVMGYITEYPKDGNWFLPSCNMQITEVLKGDVNVGNHSFSRASTTTYTKENEVFIAFLDSTKTISWIATTKENNDIKTTLLFVEGLYDFNAYLVYPAQITYTQLNKYLKTGSFSLQYQGNLTFYDSKKKTITPSSTYFKAIYHYPGTSEVITNLSLKDFTDTPQLSSGAWDNTITIHYESNLVRPLKILGISKDINISDDIVLVDFYVEEPFFFDEESFQKYVQNPQLGSPFYQIDVLSQKDTIFSFPLGYSNIDYAGFKKQIPHYFFSTGLSFSDTKYIEGEYKGDNYRIDFKTTSIPIPVEELGVDAEAIQSLLIGPWEGVLTKNDSKDKSLKVKIKLGETGFLQNPNYKK